MRTGARRLGSAALLGLPAALLAHTLVFGGEHTLAGSMHGIAIDLGAAFAFLGTLAAAIGAVRRWRFLSLNFVALASGAAAWFGVIELCERAHGIPFVAAVFAVLFAAWLVRAVLLAFAQTIVAIAAILHGTFTDPARPATRLRYSAPPRKSPAHSLRLFSRPPPAFS